MQCSSQEQISHKVLVVVLEMPFLIQILRKLNAIYSSQCSLGEYCSNIVIFYCCMVLTRAQQLASSPGSTQFFNAVRKQTEKSQGARLY